MQLFGQAGITASSFQAAAGGATLLWTVNGGGKSYGLGGTNLASSSTQVLANAKGGGGLKAFVFDITDGTTDFEPSTVYADGGSGAANYAKTGDMSEDWSAIQGPGQDNVFLVDNTDGSLERTFTSPISASGNFGAYNGIGVSDLYTAVGNAAALRMYIYNNSTGALIATITTPSGSGHEVRTTDTHALYSHGTDGPVTIYDPSNGNSRYTISNPQYDSSSSFDYFGRYLDVCDDYILLSAHLEDNPSESATNVGVAYLFNTSDGSLAQTFVNPINFDTEFGMTLAVSDTYTAIGSYNEDPDGGSINGYGVVRVYNNSDGSLYAKIDNPVAAGAQFGSQVSLSNTATTSHIIIGARYQGVGSQTSNGAVYAYSLG